MARYKEYNQHQGQFIAVDFQSQILAGTFEHALNHIIDNELDLSSFDSVFKNDETGAPAYDPRVMLKIILFGYSQGITSSRELEKACQRHVTYMALCANKVPHFTKIADFVSSMGERSETLFTEVLTLCGDMGLIGKQMFAIDGCKISSNASKEWSGKKKDYQRKQKKMESEVRKLLKRHKELDSQKHDLQDQISKEKKAIESYRSKIKKYKEFIKNNDDRIGAQGRSVQSNITDNESAKMKSGNSQIIQGYNGIAAVDAKHQVIVGAEAYGKGDERESVGPMIEEIENNFNDSFKEGDLSKTIVVADTGFNSEAVLKTLDEKGVDAYIPDQKFRQRDPKLKGQEKHDRSIKRDGSKRKKDYFSLEDYVYNPEKDQYFCPTGEYLYKSGKPFEIKGFLYQRYQGRDSKCRDCSLRKKCIRGEGKHIIKQLAIQIKKIKQTTYTQLMKDKIDTIKGRFVYSRRMGIVEPVFAHICKNMKLDYFSMRGRAKVNTQWKLFAAIHNLKKIFRFAPSFV